MTRPIVAHISTQALQHNLRVVRQYAPESRIAAVIKASAYGHGTLRVARALHDADAFALLNTEAAAQLRHAGLAHPIVMLEGMFAASEIDDYIALHLIPVLHQPEQLQWLLQAELPRPFDVWVKLNTGMNRLGLEACELDRALGLLADRADVTLMTHFADADGRHGIGAQLARFHDMRGDRSLPVSLANSAALLRYPLASDAAVPRLRGPLLLLHGAEDGLIPPSHSRALAALAAQARLVVVPGAGHNDLHQFEPYLDALRQALAAL